MIVANRHYRERNFVVGANALKAMSASLRGLGAFDYSAITDCSMLTPFQQSQAPQCGGGSGASLAPATYVAPTLATPSNCIDPASGLPFFTPDCVNANLATQASNNALSSEANRAVFLANCNTAWLMNDQRYAELNLPRPANDCESKTFGQVFSSSGPMSFASITAATDLIPSVASSNLQVQNYQTTAAPTQSVAQQQQTQSSAGGGNSATGSGPIDLTSVTDKVKEISSGSVHLLGYDVPYLAIAAGVGLLFLVGGKG